MSRLATKEVLPVATKEAFGNHDELLVEEKRLELQSKEDRELEAELTQTIKALRCMTGRWNPAIMILLEHSDWDFVSKLLVELYESVGRRTLRQLIDVPSLVSDMSRSKALMDYVETYREDGVVYDLEVVNASMDALVAGFISRYQFMAILRHITSGKSSFVSIDDTPRAVIGDVVDQILNMATLYKSRYQSEFASMVALIESDVPWISKCEAYLVFAGKKKQRSLKRNRTSWDWGIDEVEEVAGTPPKRLRFTDDDVGDMFSGGTTSRELFVDDGDLSLFSEF